VRKLSKINIKCNVLAPAESFICFGKVIWLKKRQIDPVTGRVWPRGWVEV